MSKKSTEELEKILGNTHIKKAQVFLQENTESMIMGDRPFSFYMKKLIKEKGLRQQDILLYADIPERYGYKLLSEEKRTRQRDIILRICYAAEFTLEETQKALKIYEMPQLFIKLPRDAVLMLAFNQRPGGIIEVNGLLRENGMEPLRTSGIQE